MATDAEFERFVHGEWLGEEVHGRFRGKRPRQDVREQGCIVPYHEDADPSAAAALHPGPSFLCSPHPPPDGPGPFGDTKSRADCAIGKWQIGDSLG